LIAGGKATGLTDKEFPKLHAYVERLQVEPGYKKAADKIIELDGKFEAYL
jgi:glutathione S-transferase